MSRCVRLLQILDGMIAFGLCFGVALAETPPSEFTTPLLGHEEPFLTPMMAEFAGSPLLLEHAFISSESGEATEQTADTQSASSTMHSSATSRDYVRAGDFPRSLLLPSSDVSVKIGGYAKLDLIQDFDSIGSTDGFDTSTIPTSGPRKANTRLHARQTRLNLDFRHASELGDVQVFTEGDFFGSGNTFRLRHGYGRVGPVLAGQTWSTFMDEVILPDLVDFENPTGALLTRRGLLRWTQSLPVMAGLEYSVAIEDPSPAFSSAAGTFENALPDFIGRLRLQDDTAHAQLAGFVTRARFDPVVGADSEAVAWGFSLSATIKLLESDKVMGQVSGGDGIERFRNGQSYDLDASGALIAVPALSWYVCCEHAWSKQVKSVFAYSRAEVDTPTVAPASLRSTDYLAANILWTPVERLRLGFEYLHGVREDQDGSEGVANRLQFAVWYYLP